jgi:hypothetical protein
LAAIERGDVSEFTPELMDEIEREADERPRLGLSPKPDVCPSFAHCSRSRGSKRSPGHPALPRQRRSTCPTSPSSRRECRSSSPSTRRCGWRSI